MKRFLVSLEDSQLKFLARLIKKHSFIMNRMDAIRYCINLAKTEQLDLEGKH